MTGGLTIGQAAGLVGVTTKTVRHYHRVGLLDEPRRDVSGYRRYTATDLLRLVRIRTLADAGVALVEIGELLDAEPRAFAAALADVERRLDNRIAELSARRDTLHLLLVDGDRAVLPDLARAVLDRYVDLGFPADYVDLQREGLILARALAPALFDGLLTQLERRLDDTEYVELQKRAWEARTWESHDPRLDDLASAIADNLLTDRALLESQAEFFSTAADSRYQLINNHRADERPTVARLNTLVESKLRAVLES